MRKLWLRRRGYTSSSSSGVASSEGLARVSIGHAVVRCYGGGETGSVCGIGRRRCFLAMLDRFWRCGGGRVIG